MLRRELSFFQATAINMIDMVGIGPFVTTAAVAAIMGSAHLAILAWVVGMLIAFIDASVWSELGAKFPHAGGTYRFVREAYGESTWGRYFSFLFVWQTTFTAPLVIASGALGFASYSRFFLSGVPQTTTPWSSRLIAIGVVAMLTMMLYRKISDVGRISVVLWWCVVIIMTAIIAAGFSLGNPAHLIGQVVAPEGGWLPQLSDSAVWTALGVAALPTMYSYLGYYNVCNLGAEIASPQRVIPRSMYVSILGIGILYILMQLAVFSVLSAEQVKISPFVVSDMLSVTFGRLTANIGTMFILVIALASLFSVMLGYTRIPYAAAQDGLFFRQFGRLHPTENFPHIALLMLAGIAIVFVSTLTITDAIKSIITMRVFTQFIAQTVGLMLVRRRLGSGSMPWKMWLYPLPALLTIAIWVWIYSSAKPLQQAMGVVAPLIGTFAFLVFARRTKTWPYRTVEEPYDI